MGYRMDMVLQVQTAVPSISGSKSISQEVFTDNIILECQGILMKIRHRLQVEFPLPDGSWFLYEMLGRTIPGRFREQMLYPDEHPAYRRCALLY